MCIQSHEKKIQPIVDEPKVEKEKRKLAGKVRKNADNS